MTAAAWKGRAGRCCFIRFSAAVVERVFFVFFLVRVSGIRVLFWFGFVILVVVVSQLTFGVPLDP